MFFHHYPLRRPGFSNTAFLTLPPTTAHPPLGTGLVFLRDSRTLVAPAGSFQRGYTPPPGPPPRLPEGGGGGVARHRRLASAIQMYGWMYYHFLVETLPKLILLQRHIEAAAAAAAAEAAAAAAADVAVNASTTDTDTPPAATAAAENPDDGVWDVLVWGQPHEVRRAALVDLRRG